MKSLKRLENYIYICINFLPLLAGKKFKAYFVPNYSAWNTHELSSTESCRGFGDSMLTVLLSSFFFV